MTDGQFSTFVSRVTIYSLIAIMALAAIIDNTVGGNGISYAIGLNAWIPAVLIVGPILERIKTRKLAVA